MKRDLAREPREAKDELNQEHKKHNAINNQEKREIHEQRQEQAARVEEPYFTLENRCSDMDNVKHCQDKHAA